jgi:inosine-uridine nucleoside N-ribohydrolase
MVSNPSVTRRPDSAFLLIYKAVGKKNKLPFGGPVVHLTATSRSPAGPFVKQQVPVFTFKDAHFPAEDPYIWYQNNKYYAIVKDMNGYFTKAGRSLALFESGDGFSWEQSDHVLVSDLTVNWENGTKQQMSHLERPQIYFEDGKPKILLVAADILEGGVINESYNIRIPLVTPESTRQKRKSFIPGQVWHDNNGCPINAHGGGIIYTDGKYYWYGEHKLPGRSEKEFADGGVHCYSSVDLYNWKDEGIVLSVDYKNEKSDIAAGCILERPKVVYNKNTQQYVMFFKLYPKGTGYETGYVGVATSSVPHGPFAYIHKFIGAGSNKGSGDFCMFRDKDENLYHFTVRKPDKAFVSGKLRNDYLFPEGKYNVLSDISLHTEAPAVINRKDTYYMLGSGSSGWAPNTARSFSAGSVTGPYLNHGNPCAGINPVNQLGPEKTFGGQVSYILPVQGFNDCYMAMFDIWKPEIPIEGLYVWLPLRFKDGKVSIEWMDEWDLSVFNENPEIPNVILDTDFGPDYDDVGAVAFLHAAADSGLVNILATVLSNRHILSAPALQTVNEYFKRPHLPVGAPKNDGVNIGSWENWLDTVCLRYPCMIKSTDEVPDAVEIYRKVLADSEDNSVTIVTIGFLTNLHNLLKSLPDQYSDLIGIELVRRKVKSWIAMGGEFPEGHETNIRGDSKASGYVIKHWPTTIIFSGAEVGRHIKTGAGLINDTSINNSPVKDIYSLVMNRIERDKDGRSSYDQTAVMYAVYGCGNFFDLERGRFIVKDQGYNTWEKASDGIHYRLILKSSVSQIAEFIEKRMRTVSIENKKLNRFFCP